MNDFENYILKGKDKLEVDQVDPSVWLSIENAMLFRKNKSYRKAITISLITLFTCLGLGVAYMMNKKPAALDEEKILAALNLTQHGFTKKVNLKKQKLAKATIPEQELEDVQILLQQLEFMDGQFQDYKQYITEHGYQEFIGEQIHNFYKSKIKLLDKIQEEVEKINYYESKRPSNQRTIKINL